MNRENWVDFDHFLDAFDLDERTARRLKRKRVDTRVSNKQDLNKALQSEKHSWEGDYLKFLEEMSNFLQDDPVLTREGGDNPDPDYNLFLENAKEDGNSYVVEFSNSDGKSVQLKYERVESDGKRDEQTTKKVGNVPKRKKIEVAEGFSEDTTEGSILQKTKVGSATGEKLRSGPVNNQKLRQKAGLEMEDSYLTFFDNMRIEGDHMVLEIGNLKVKYEDSDTECTSDSDILVTDYDPYRDRSICTPFVSKKVDHINIEEDANLSLGVSSENSKSLFREKVLNILKQPYDHEEYEKLMKAVTERKPLQGSLELRGRTVVYPVDKCGKSFLDHHADLEKKITAAEDNEQKKLNILRGFFYWLENLEQDGKFQPWLDVSCLAVMPGS